jgi:DNA-binding transcriptional ArsR family regulator
MDPALDPTIAALADHTRRELLARLARGPIAAGKLAEGFPMSRPAIAKHLRVLREVGLVYVHKEGRRQLYELSPEGLVELEKVMEEVGRFWDVALTSFKRSVEEEE